MLQERIFRKFIMLLTLFTIIVVFLTTYRYYKKLPRLSEVKQNASSHLSENEAFPIEPFEAFSMKNDDLMIKLGKGEEGSGQDYDNMYIDYRQEWFSKYVKSRFYYGDYGRVYQIILDYPLADSKQVYKNMKKTLGQPLYDGIYMSSGEGMDQEGEEAVVYWIKDSVRYTMANYEAEDLCMVTMNLQYFANVENYDLGQRPIEIQRINNVRLGDNSSEGNLILVGDKPEYTSTFFERIFIVYGNQEGTILGNFKDEFNGGFYPNVKVVDLDDDGQNEVVVEAENEYTTFYTVLKLQNGEFSVTYAGEKNPLKEEKKQEKKQEKSKEENKNQ